MLFDMKIYVRVGLKSVAHDLESTRRENDFLREILENGEEN